MASNPTGSLASLDNISGGPPAAKSAGNGAAAAVKGTKQVPLTSFFSQFAHNSGKANGAMPAPPHDAKDAAATENDEAAAAHGEPALSCSVWNTAGV